MVGNFPRTWCLTVGVSLDGFDGLVVLFVDIVEARGCWLLELELVADWLCREYGPLRCCGFTRG